MVDLRNELDTAKGWATLHVLAACGICAALGLVVGALLF